MTRDRCKALDEGEKKQKKLGHKQTSGYVRRNK